MRTNIVLDDGLVDEAMRLTGVQTKKAVVHLALEELVRARRRRRILRLKGKLEWEGDLDEMRRGRSGSR